ncbi:hypothetical protein PSAB6_690001 [Paraburkholderia sabiae]|nr:hypothetical protein PSAB6_690001 [Paraburkholderia sabiae]
MDAFRTMCTRLNGSLKPAEKNREFTSSNVPPTLTSKAGRFDARRYHPTPQGVRAP